MVITCFGKVAARLKKLFSDFSRLTVQTSVMPKQNQIACAQMACHTVADRRVCGYESHLSVRMTKVSIFSFLNAQVYIRYWQQSENT